MHSDVISPDNGLVKAGILRAPSLFDCVGQLWRNGHYLPVSGSIKKPPRPPPHPALVTPALGFPQGEGRGPVTHWSGESDSNHNSEPDKRLHLTLEALCVATGGEQVVVFTQEQGKVAFHICFERVQGFSTVSVLSFYVAKCLFQSTCKNPQLP